MSSVIGISVVIPTYKRKEVLKDTVNSLLSGDAVPDEIIIVDQNETSAYTDELLDLDHVIILRGCEPSSAKARNIGLSRASNDVVVFCDDDILVSATTLSKVYSKFEINPRQALVAVPNATDSFDTRFHFKDLLSWLCGMKKPFHRGGYVVKSTMRGRYAIGRDCIEPTEWAMGYFFVVRKSLCLRWNTSWDENLYSYAYAEDLDFSLRYCEAAKRSEMETTLDSTVFVEHLGSKEYRIPNEKSIFFLIANRYYLLHKIFPNKGKLMMRFNNFCAGWMSKEHKLYRRATKACLQHLDDVEAGKIKLAEAKWSECQLLFR